MEKVTNERLRVIQFLRFQKAVDGTFFAAVKPVYNVLPLTLAHLKDRFADQRWLLYDLKREYGYYYDLKEATEVRFEEKDAHLLSGLLGEELMDADEKLFQQMWKLTSSLLLSRNVSIPSYTASICLPGFGSICRKSCKSGCVTPSFRWKRLCV